MIVEAGVEVVVFGVEDPRAEEVRALAARFDEAGGQRAERARRDQLCAGWVWSGDRLCAGHPTEGWTNRPGADHRDKRQHAGHAAVSGSMSSSRQAPT